MSDNQLTGILSQLKAIKAQSANTVDVEIIKALDECILQVENAIKTKPSPKRILEFVKIGVEILTFIKMVLDMYK